MTSPHYQYRVIQLHEAQYMADLTSVKHDLTSAQKYAEAFVNEWDLLFKGTPTMKLEILEAIGIACIITYARCFKSGNREKAIMSSLDSSIPDEFRPHHNELLDIRDKHVAHPVNGMEEGEARAYFDSRQLDQGIIEVTPGHTSYFTLSAANAQKLFELCSLQLSMIDFQLKCEQQRLTMLYKDLPSNVFLNWPTQNPIPSNYSTSKRLTKKRRESKKAAR